MKHREANSREVEKRSLQEAIHLVRKMRRRESKAFANFNPQDKLTFMASNFDTGRPPTSLLFKYRFILPPLSAPLDPYLFFGGSKASLSFPICW